MVLQAPAHGTNGFFVAAQHRMRMVVYAASKTSVEQSACLSRTTFDLERGLKWAEIFEVLQLALRLLSVWRGNLKP